VFVPWESRLGEDAILPLRVFSNSVFRVAGFVAFLLGAGMFGGLVLMPLYLQIVRGESPTQAGLSMIPLMIGMMGSSLVVGRIMRRTGRYKIFPIVGTAVGFVGEVLFSTLGVDTPMWQVMAYMVIVGAGLGMSMQMLIIAVQNALPPQDMGLSTSSATFFRSMGGTFGAAVSLAVLFGTVLGNIRDRFTAAHIPTQFLGHVSSTSLNNTHDLLSKLPAPIKHLVLQGFADSMRTVFVVVAALLLSAFIGTWFIKEVPLRAQAGVPSQGADGSSVLETV
jgi:MFS family permease